MELQTGISSVYWEVLFGHANTFVVCLCPSPFIQLAFRNVISLFIIVLVRWVHYIDARVGFPLLWSTDLEWVALCDFGSVAGRINV